MTYAPLVVFLGLLVFVTILRSSGFASPRRRTGSGGLVLQVFLAFIPIVLMLVAFAGLFQDKALGGLAAAAMLLGLLWLLRARRVR